MKEMNELIGKHVRVFVKNLSERPVIYTGTVLSIEDGFLIIRDKIGDRVTINMHDIIQIVEGG